MGTATILGTEYQTVTMPDGRIWMAENLNWDGRGTVGYYGNGRLYTYSSISGINFGDWRLPTPDEMSAMVASVPGVYWGWAGLSVSSPDAYLFRSIDWNGNNSSQMNFLPAGFYDGTLQGFNSALILCSLLDEVNYILYENGVIGEPAIIELGGNDPYIRRKVVDPNLGCSVRLIYDPVPPGHEFRDASTTDNCLFASAPERGYEPKITPSITWNELPSGLYRALDDGSQYDAFDADITVYVTTEELSTWETFYLAHKAVSVRYRVNAGVYPFGPHIPCTDDYVNVQVIDWQNLGKVGTVADLWQLNISMRLQDSYTVTTPAGVPALFGEKYASPTWVIRSVPHLTDDGKSNISTRNQGATQTCQVIADNFTTTEAASIVNWCLFTRGASFTYSPAPGLDPFGASLGDGPFTVRLLEWTIQKPNPSRWDFTFTLSRDYI